MPTLAAINPVNITIPGIIIALVFLTAIVGTLTWMLRVPKATPATLRVARAVRHTRRIGHILVPTHGGTLSDRIVGMASQIASRRGATLTLLYVIEVPRYFPIDATLSEENFVATEAIERASRIARTFGVKPKARIIRARDAGPAIVQEADEEGADLIMMGAGPPPRRRMAGLGPAAEYVFRYASCEVIFNRAAMTQDEAPWKAREIRVPEHPI